MSRYHRYYVYILRCSDGSYYTGVTNNVERRLLEHQSGESKMAYTYDKRPVELVFTAEFSSIDFAIEKEKQVKRWSKKKKEALINGDFNSLPKLSKKVFKP